MPLGAAPGAAGVDLALCVDPRDATIVPPPRGPGPRARDGAERAHRRTWRDDDDRLAGSPTRGPSSASARAGPRAPSRRRGRPERRVPVQPPPADAPKLYPNLDLDFVPAMTVAEWARGAALAALAALLHAAFVAKLLSRKLADAGAPWHVAAAPTVALAALVFLLHRYVTLEAKEQARLIPSAKPRTRTRSSTRWANRQATTTTCACTTQAPSPAHSGPPRAVVACCHGFGANAWSWEKAR